MPTETKENSISNAIIIIEFSEKEKKKKCFSHVVAHLETLFYQPFPKPQNLDFCKLKELQTTISNLTKMTESFPKGYKTLWEKERTYSLRAIPPLPTDFSKDVRYRHVKTRGFFGKG